MSRYFHQTKVEFLKSIIKNGLIASSGENSKLIEDEKQKVCFSEGFDGAIGLNSEFQRKFDKLKKESKLEAKTVDEFLGESVYLMFDSDEIINESNKGEFSFIDGWTYDDISSDKLNVCMLKNKKNNEVTYNKDDIVKYMMKTISMENFSKYSKDIQDRISKYYELRKDDLDSFNEQDYNFETMSLIEFYDNYISKEKESYNPWKTDKKELVGLSNKEGIIQETIHNVSEEIER